jgi:hypothetical protein
VRLNVTFSLTTFSQLINKGVNTHLIALVFLLKLINDTLFNGTVGGIFQKVQ